MASDISNELIMNAETVAQADTHYTGKVDFRGCVGDAILFIASTAGSITVTQQCAWTKSGTFYDPVNTSGAAVGSVRADLTVTTGVYVVFTPVLAPYIRFKVVEGNSAETAVTIRLLFRKDI